MNSDQAKELSHLLSYIGGQLQQSVIFVNDHDTDENFLAYRKAVGEMMGVLFCDAMQPLYHRFPELLPDYLGGPYKIPEAVFNPTFYQAETTDLT